MKKHEITLEGLQDFMDTVKVTYAEVVSAKFPSENKKLTISLNGTFEVRRNNKILHKGMQAFSAMEKYNEL